MADGTDTQQAQTPADALTVDGVDLSDLKLFTDDPAPAEAAPAEALEQPAEDDPDPTEPAEQPEAAPAPEPKPEPKADLAAIARIERQLQKERAERKAIEDRLKARDADEITEDNVFDVLAKKGITLQRLADMAVNGKPQPKPQTPEEKERAELRAQVEELRKEREAEKQRQQETERQSMLSKFRGDIASAIDKDEEFPHLAAYGDEGVDAVFRHIQAHAQRTLQETGEAEVLDVRQVAAEFEKQFQERYEKVATRLTGRGKAPNASGVSPQQTASRPPASGQRTLTNRAAASAAPARTGPKTDDELEAEAVAALKFIA